jgi:hypothetical protein
MQAEFKTAFASYGAPQARAGVDGGPGGQRVEAMIKPSKGEGRSRKCCWGCARQGGRRVQAMNVGAQEGRTPSESVA